MFRFLNKIIDRSRVISANRSSQGQAAIILILVIAATLVFYAASLNFGELSKSKTSVTIASNSGASILASNMASYGQQLSETSLKGKQKHCDGTSLVLAIITLIIAVILAPFTAGQSLWAVATILTMLAIAIAVYAVVMQIVVIQPGISAAWNRIISRTLSQSNQFTESALQTGFRSVVKDTVELPDVIDADGDGEWVRLSDLALRPYADTVSRPGVFYSHRLVGIRGANITVVRDFLLALQEFTEDGGDGWGIHDHTSIDECIGNAECHPCCQPDTLLPAGSCAGNAARCTSGECNDCSGGSLETFGDVTDITIQTCRDQATAGGIDWFTECEDQSPYPGYAWVYDAAHEDFNNPFLSFRELIGKDDEHRDFYKDTATTVLSPFNPYSNPQNVHTIGLEGFLLEDATNFYVPPVYVSPEINPVESRRGIYPFFHKLSDWGIDLTAIEGNGPSFVVNEWECHWCDPSDTTICIPCPATIGDQPFPREIPQLVLPIDPDPFAIPPYNGLIFNTTYFVDGSNLVPGEPPLRVDNITFPNNIFAASDECADDVLGSPNGFWKEGLDRYCSTTWPYDVECAKHGSFVGVCGADGENFKNCMCSENIANADLFPDDTIDNIWIGLGEFSEWAENFTAVGLANLQKIAGDLPLWYPEAANWVAPPDLSNDIDGWLTVFLNEMIEMRRRIVNWLVNSPDDIHDENDGYVGADCFDVWCVTPSNSPPVESLPIASSNACPEVPLDQYATYDVNLNGVRGDIVDIKQCLSYNVEGYDYAAAAAFRNCLTNCAPAFCTVGEELPVFHLDGVTPYIYPVGSFALGLDCDPSDFDPWRDAMILNLAEAVNPNGTNLGNDVRFDLCGETCSLENCFSLPRSLIPLGTYDPNAYAAANPALNGDWRDLTAFNNCLNNCNVANCEVGPRLPQGAPYSYPVTVITAADCSSNWFPGGPWFDAVTANKALATPTDEADMAPMIKCVFECSNLNCQAMPLTNLASSVTYFAADPAGYDFEAGGVDCNAATNRLLESSGWFTEIQTALTASIGIPEVLCDPISAGWLEQTRQSALEATNQVAKFHKRRDYLEARLDEVTPRDPLVPNGSILSILDEAIFKFSEFLLPIPGPPMNPVEALIDAFDNFNPNEIGLPNQLIYGWRDEDLPNGDRGKWHVVKLEAYIPGNCNLACGFSQNANTDPGWPRIKTYTKKWGLKRCYELVSHYGSVKFRAIRYDEEMQSGLIRFPNGVPIWRYKSAHPARPQGTATSPNLLGSVCAGTDTATIKEFQDGSDTLGIYNNAFIMNEYMNLTDPYDPSIPIDSNRTCWNLAHDFLTQGVVDETCANYSWMNGRMDFKFVECKEF